MRLVVLFLSLASSGCVPASAALALSGEKATANNSVQDALIISKRDTTERVGVTIGLSLASIGAGIGGGAVTACALGSLGCNPNMPDDPKALLFSTGATLLFSSLAAAVMIPVWLVASDGAKQKAAKIPALVSW